MSVACHDASPSMPKVERIIELLTSLVHLAPVMLGVSDILAVDFSHYGRSAMSSQRFPLPIARAALLARRAPRTRC